MSLEIKALIAIGGAAVSLWDRERSGRWCVGTEVACGYAKHLEFHARALEFLRVEILLDTPRVGVADRDERERMHGAERSGWECAMTTMRVMEQPTFNERNG